MSKSLKLKQNEHFSTFSKEQNIFKYITAVQHGYLMDFALIPSIQQPKDANIAQRVAAVLDAVQVLVVRVVLELALMLILGRFSVNS